MPNERKRPRGPHQSDPIANTGNTGSSTPAADDRTGGHGMIHSFTNVSGQPQGQGQGQSQGQGQGQGQRQSQGQGQGQGRGQGRGQAIDGARPVAVDYDRNLGTQVVRMTIQMPFFAPPPVPSYNQILISSQNLGNINIVPGVTSGFFMPGSIHQNNIRFWSDPNMVSGYVLRQGTPLIQMGIPMPSFSQVLPFPYIPLRVVRPRVNPAFLMPRTSIHENNTGRMPNTNMAHHEHIEGIGETSDTTDSTSNDDDDDGSDDSTDQHSHEHDREHEHEHDSTSRDA